MKSLMFVALFIAIVGLASSGQESKLLYKNDFEQAAVGQVPDDLGVQGGAFAVQQNQTNKFLELPGAPLDSFAVLFGPTEKENVQASVRVWSTNRGRRYPTFALGLNGFGGYRVQVSPGKKLLELYRGDTLITSAPFVWTSGDWTHLRLQVLKATAGWRIEAKAWPEGKPEPSAWIISLENNEELPSGRAVIFGSPFSETPIRFDDLTIARTSP